MKGKTVFFMLFVLLATTVFALVKPNKSNQLCRFKENRHYKIISDKTSQYPKVTELFSVYCGTCYLWELSILDRIKIRLVQQNVAFEQAHSSIAGKFATQISTALAIAKLENNYEQLKKTLFFNAREQSKNWKTEQDFFASLEKLGISEQHYKKNQFNLEVLKTIADWQYISNLTDVVPSIIINDKYLIITQQMKNIEELEDIIMFLLEISNKNTNSTSKIRDTDFTSLKYQYG